MMRILVMVFHFPPMSGGGVVLIVDIVNKLAELGNDVTVLTPEVDWNGEIYEPKINPNVEIIRVKIPSKSNIKVAARRCKSNMKAKGLEICTEKNFDFIFTIFHPFHLVPKAAVECAKQLGIPSIVKVDDAVYEKSSGLKSIQRKIEKVVNGRTLRNANHVLVSNEQTKKIVNQVYNVSVENISILPNGVDLSMFYATKKDPYKIVFSGAMYYHRGLDILLEAAPKIINEMPDVKIVLIGSGNELEKLKEISTKKNLDANVEFKGWIRRDDIPQNISNASIGLGPLRVTDVTEGALPIKVLEYMACSLPIIAQKGTLPDDVLVDEKNGYFIDGVDELAEKIVLLLKNSKQVEIMGKESLKMVQKFSWENVTKSILKICN